jgi:hypothetical protein
MNLSIQINNMVVLLKIHKRTNNYNIYKNINKIREGKSTFRILTGKPLERRLLGRPRHICEDNIRTDLEELVSI